MVSGWLGDDLIVWSLCFLCGVRILHGSCQFLSSRPRRRGCMHEPAMYFMCQGRGLPSRVLWRFSSLFPLLLLAVAFPKSNDGSCDDAFGVSFGRLGTLHTLGALGSLVRIYCMAVACGRYTYGSHSLLESFDGGSPACSI